MNLSRYIDHTYLKADATREIIIRICQEAVAHNFKAVCINPCWVSLAASLLANSEVEIATVIGFPLGATSTAAKISEALQAIDDGATELDMVMNIGNFLSGDYEIVKSDIASIVTTANNIPVKVIIETALLNEEQKRHACKIAEEAGAAYVKTSTGFGPGGATVSDVYLMRQTVSDHIGVKASGGIKTAAQAKAMIEAGATRLGASAGVKIVTEANESE